MSVVAISGGVGGAKLANGLYRALPADTLTIVGNTGDDFVHLGLHISPDLDSILYALASLNDEARGWGRAGESWTFMEALGAMGGEDWFLLGDRDLATHVVRSQRLAAGETLTAVTAAFLNHLGIAARLLPMSDDPVRTIVETDIGALAFQDYFVRHRCAPAVRGLRFEGAEQARANPAFFAALADPGLEAVILCPSNPWLSIDPILAVPGVMDALRTTQAPVVAVSPLIGGRAVKGPTVAIMESLGVARDQPPIAAHYATFLDGLVIDTGDAAAGAAIAVPTHVCPILMRGVADQEALAREALAFARRIGKRAHSARASA